MTAHVEQLYEELANHKLGITARPERSDIALPISLWYRRHSHKGTINGNSRISEDNWTRTPAAGVVNDVGCRDWNRCGRHAEEARVLRLHARALVRPSPQLNDSRTVVDLIGTVKVRAM